MEGLNFETIAEVSNLSLPCVFCYKPASILSGKIDKRFLKILPGFLKQNKSTPNCDLYCCVECSVLVKIFCEQYFQWKTFELKAHYTAERLINITKLASRVSSRLSDARQMFSCFDSASEATFGDRLNALKTFRRKFVEKCTTKISEEKPFVQLHNINSVSATKSELHKIKQEPEILVLSEIANFFVWSVTYAAVAWLATQVPELHENSVGHPLELSTFMSIDEDFSVDEINGNTENFLSRPSIPPDFKTKENEHSISNGNLLAMNELAIEQDFALENVSNSEDFDAGDNIGNSPSPGIPLDFETDENDNSMNERDSVSMNERNFVRDENCSIDTFQETTTAIKSEQQASTDSLEDCSVEQSVGISELKPKAEQLPLQDKQKYLCKPCELPFGTKYQLFKHKRLTHSAKPLRSYKCNACNKSFWRYDLLRWHKLHSKLHQVVKKLKSQNSENKLNDNHTSSENTESLSVAIPCEFAQKSYAETTAEFIPEPNASELSSSDNQKRYNLRKNRKQSYPMPQEESTETSKHRDQDFEMSNYSTSSSESNSSISTYSDSELNEMKLEKGERENARSQHKFEFAKCRQEGCYLTFIRGKDMRFFNHQKLHASGRFRCSFCNLTKMSIAQLFKHELLKHPNKKASSSDNFIKFCPRCKYSSAKHNVLLSHFAEVHIGGFNSRKGKKNYVECDICSLSVFNIKATLDNHFQLYHDKSQQSNQEIYNCSVKNCAAYFLKEMQKQEHEKILHKILPASNQEPETTDTKVSKHITYLQTEEGLRFQCKFCFKNFKSMQAISIHQLACHPNEISGSKDLVKIFCGKYPCAVAHCTKTFRFENELQQHAQLHGSFACKICGDFKEYAPDLALHESEHDTLSCLIVSKAPEKTKELKIRCSRCSDEFVGKIHYIRHFLGVHLNLTYEDKQAQCPICQVALHKTFRNHYKTHHKKKDNEEFKKCYICPAYFVTGFQLMKHMSKAHWQEKCPECGQSFAHSPQPHSRLERHLEQFHPELLPHLKFSCDRENCFRRFFTQAELDIHKAKNICDYQKTVRQKILKCSQCGKEFKGKYSLQAHVNTVHVTRSFVCEECGKSFKTKVTLSYHMEFHKDPKDWQWQCSECGRKFVTKQKLDQHKRTHTKEKPFVCQYCGEKYAHRHNWKNHVKNKHPEKETSSKQPLKGNYMSRKGSKKGECIMAGTKQK